jgi:hypothetical protein
MPTGSVTRSLQKESRLAFPQRSIAKYSSRMTAYSTASAIKSKTCSAKLKDWRRIHTRYDRCAHTFMSAICIAATVIFWL